MASKSTNVSNAEDNLAGVVETPAIVAAQPNALQTAKQKADRELREATANKKKLGSYYMSEKKVTVSISPFYAPRLGRVVPITVNGITVCVPADGKSYTVPATFAASVKRKLANIDRLEARGKALSDVANNVESFAGQLRF